MNEMTLIDNGCVTMSSLEIATVTGKQHKHVLRDIRVMLAELYGDPEGIPDKDAFESFCDKMGWGIDNPKLDHQRIQGVRVLRDDRGYVSEIMLDYEHTMTLIAGYSVKLRKAIIGRWQELEKRVQAPAATLMLPSTQARVLMEDTLAVAALFEVPKHLAQVEAVKAARLTFGVDYSEVLALAPAQDDIQPEDEMLEPTELGRRFGVSGTTMNQMLASLGLQVGGPGCWVATSEGERLSSRHQWRSGFKSGYNYKWRVAAIANMIHAEV